MLAYYALRALITKAAKKADEDPDRLSFVHTVNVLQRWIQQPGVSPLNKIPQVMIEHLVDEILEERVVSSRGQRKLRGRRPKMSKYPIRRRGNLSRVQWIPKITMRKMYHAVRLVEMLGLMRKFQKRGRFWQILYTI